VVRALLLRHLGGMAIGAGVGGDDDLNKGAMVREGGFLALLGLVAVVTVHILGGMGTLLPLAVDAWIVLGAVATDAFFPDRRIGWRLFDHLIGANFFGGRFINRQCRDGKGQRQQTGNRPSHWGCKSTYSTHEVLLK
jgi:hypothetical protein